MAVQKKINWGRMILAMVFVIVVGYLIARNPVTFGNILLVVLGFGAVVVVHEFGHFIVAKLSGIKVEAFSIGFPPTLAAFTRKEDGFRLEVLPRLFESNSAVKPEVADAALEGKLSSSMSPSSRAWDTEYRIGLIPFGGFVKMLGQEDTGAAQSTADPRSFANKPIWIRIAVVAAGVVFNAISAFIIFMIVFLMGIQLPPAVVGGVTPDSPAHRQGIQAGDEIVEVNGDPFVDFTSVVMAPALSRKGEQIHFKVKRPDGRIEPISVIAEQAVMAEMPIRSLGIEQARSLTIERKIPPAEAGILNEMKGLMPGDRITAVDGKSVQNIWDMEDMIAGTYNPQTILTVERGTDAMEKTDVVLPLQWTATIANFSSEFDLSHVGSLVPRLKITSVLTQPTARGGIARMLGKKTPVVPDTNEQLRDGDIIVKAGEIENPTYEELRKVTTDHKNREMPMAVLRRDAAGKESRVEVKVTPREIPNSDRVTIGIAVALDAEHPVLASTVGSDQPTLDIPRGATITAVDGVDVGSFFEIARIINSDTNAGQRISIEYRLDEQNAGSVGLDIPLEGAVHLRPIFAAVVPLEMLKVTYKAPSAVAAVRWGFKKTWQFIAQSVITLKRLISQDVSPRNLMGPVGIVSASYSIASRSLIDYVFFFGLISSCIAVMNLLPLPIVDGGVILLLLIEKLRGKPLSDRLQEIISYAGIAFLLAVFLWLTYNDFMRILFG